MSVFFLQNCIFRKSPRLLNDEHREATWRDTGELSIGSVHAGGAICLRQQRGKLPPARASPLEGPVAYSVCMRVFMCSSLLSLGMSEVYSIQPYDSLCRINLAPILR